MGNPSQKEPGLNLNSYISIGLLCSILTAGVWISTKLTKIESELLYIRRDMLTLQERMTARMSDRWTSTMMSVYASQVQRDNPTIKVPDVMRIQSQYPPPKD